MKELISIILPFLTSLLWSCDPYYCYNERIKDTRVIGVEILHYEQGVPKLVGVIKTSNNGAEISCSSPENKEFIIRVCAGGRCKALVGNKKVSISYFSSELPEVRNLKYYYCQLIVPSEPVWSGPPWDPKIIGKTKSRVVANIKYHLETYCSL